MASACPKGGIVCRPWFWNTRIPIPHRRHTYPSQEQSPLSGGYRPGHIGRIGVAQVSRAPTDSPRQIPRRRLVGDDGFLRPLRPSADPANRSPGSFSPRGLLRRRSEPALPRTLDRRNPRQHPRPPRPRLDVQLARSVCIYRRDRPRRSSRSVCAPVVPSQGRVADQSALPSLKREDAHDAQARAFPRSRKSTVDRGEEAGPRAGAVRAWPAQKLDRAGKITRDGKRASGLLEAGRSGRLSSRDRRLLGSRQIAARKSAAPSFRLTPSAV
jgi:hypothetical protein